MSVLARTLTRTSALALVAAALTLGSVTEPATTSGALELAASQSTLGKVAGQDLDYCKTTTLPADDDGSSDAVTIPFALKFFGTPYSQLWVNNNGNVTFNGPLSTYTPEDISTDTGLPIIAPFFADVDTDGAGSSQVTYGASPDGKSFCVNWADVGYYGAHDDLLNTFQLILTKDDTGAGRSAGDFDITFNYDQIQWETGDASGGAGGLGGTSALAGFSAGTGAPGTFITLPGSLTNGALLDTGPDALIGGHQGSSQVGRYVFQVLNSGLSSQLGNLTGTVVTGSDHHGVDDAYVEACPTSGGCSYTTTGADGGYSFSGLLAGAYAISVWPPDDSLFPGGGTATVTGGETTAVDPIALTAPTPMPGNVTMSNNGISGGIPSVYYGDPVTFSMTGCAGVASPTYTVTLTDGTVAGHGALTESPAGTYHATIPAFYPNHGDAVFTTNVPATCGGAVTSFNVYLDPSGIVTDQYGRPISGATVTLSRSADDTADGDYAAVPDGDTLMSASNRHNPDTTNAQGQFAWDVQVGWYKVSASAPGCTAASTPPMQVPPAQIDLAIKLSCSAAAPAPTIRPAITGTPQVGQTLHVTAGTWAAPIATVGTTLMRQVGNGPATAVALNHGAYTLTTADAGATLYAVSTGQTPAVVPPELPGAAVQFTAVTARSDSVAVPGLPRAQVGLKVKPKRPSHHKKAKVVVTVRAGAAVTGTVRLYDGKKTIGKVVTLKNGKAVIKVKLKKGKRHLTAVYSGSATVAATTSPSVKVRVR
jgi:hypothetical protein